MKDLKAWGRTTSSKIIDKSIFDFSDITMVKKYETLIENIPKLAFKNKPPHLSNRCLFEDGACSNFSTLLSSQQCIFQVP